MATFYKSQDRVKIQIEDVIFHVSPLTSDQKAEIMSHTTMKSGEAIVNITQATAKLIKYTIKDIEGAQLPNGEAYRLEFENGNLKDECVNDLLNIEMTTDLVASLYNFLSGVPKELRNASTGELLDNVKILTGETIQKK